MSDNNNDFGAFVSGFLIGGLVGAAVSLLFAPQSGEETRTLIYDKGIELKDQAGGVIDDTRVRAEELAKEAKYLAEDLQKRGKSVAEGQKKKSTKEVEPEKKAATPKKKDDTAKK
ncbi:MAG: YtxH domain-containing protein [Anaerolineales bacterium]